MPDIKLNIFGDLDLSSGGLEVATGGEEARQRIDLAISLNLGEFFTHINYGLPWIENKDENVTDSPIRYFLGEKFPNPEAYIKGELDTYIKNLPLVDSLSSEIDYNPSTREVAYRYSVITTSGEEINFPPYLQIL